MTDDATHFDALTSRDRCPLTGEYCDCSWVCLRAAEAKGYPLPVVQEGEAA